MTTPLSAPTPLNDARDLSGFDSGVATLDDWLRRRARSNQAGGASRTYVVARGDVVVGYYALASGAVAMTDAPGPLRRDMPDPIPVTLLGRMAIDRAEQGRGLGTALLQDAVLRSLQVARIVGVRGLLVHAISDVARRFYLGHGFVPSPVNPMTLILSLKARAEGT